MGWFRSSDERRYLGGLKPAKYFEDVLWPEHVETLTILGLSQERSMEVFEAFIDIDADNGGEISIDEFHAWLSFDVTKFSERVFRILDMDGSGFLDFKEFAIGIWNYCTYDAALVTKLAFDIFDVDKSGSLEMAECDALLRMVYNVRRADPVLLSKIDSNGDGKVTLDELEALVEVHNYVLQPAFDLQRALRQRVCGVRYWEAETKRRGVYFSGYDAAAQASWDSIQEILAIKSREREAEAQRDQDLRAAEERARLEAVKQREMQLKEELAARRRRRAQERDAKKATPQARKERLAKELLDRAEAELQDERVAADLDDRLAQRAVFWAAFEDWVEASRVARLADRDARLRAASGADAVARMDDALASSDGRAAFDTATALNFAYELHDKLVSRKSRLARALARALLVDHFGDGDLEPTLLAKRVMRFASKASLAAAREQARISLLDEIRSAELSEVGNALDARDDEAEKTAAQLRLDHVGDKGGVDSAWERLWDGRHGAPYWYNWKTQASLWERPHICHNCDASIPIDDIRCFQCNVDRSEYNRRRYDEDNA